MVISDEEFIKRVADEVAERLHRGQDFGPWKPYQPYWIDPRYAPFPYVGPYHVYPYWNPVTCDTNTSVNSREINWTSYNAPAFNTVAR